MSAIADLQNLVARLSNVTAKRGIIVPPPSLVRKLVGELQVAINSAICESYDMGYDMAEEVELCVDKNIDPELLDIDPELLDIDPELIEPVETAQVIELAKYRK